MLASGLIHHPSGLPAPVRSRFCNGCTSNLNSRMTNGKSLLSSRIITNMSREWHIAGRRFPIGERTLVMGVLNVTPDSFSDGNQFLSPDKALAHAEQMIAEGADIIDIGGESTRPGGAALISADEELKRVLPVIEQLGKLWNVPISIDTTKAEVAKSLRSSIAMAERRGVRRESIVIDPGIGFGKSQEQNIELIAKLDQLIAAFPEFPVLIGTSRKSFLGRILADEDETPAPADQRLHASMATITTAILKGAHIVR